MKLKKLKIEEIPSWEDNAGKYKVEITYVGEKGTITMNLDDKVSEALLLVVSNTITDFASRSAKEIQANLIDTIVQLKQLPTMEVE